MGWDMSTVTTPKARKDYHCQAADWVEEMRGWDEEQFTAEELPIIRQAKKEKYRILKGTKYIKVTGKYDGEFSVFRARKDLDAICKKYDLYEDH